MKKYKVILDTDIGDDIDDAFALALLTSYPEVDLIGVTTVYRNTYARAQQVMHYFKSVGIQNIPVLVGESHPIKEEIKPLPGDIGLDDLPCQYDGSMKQYVPNKQSAVDFIIEKVNQFPREIIFITIGALTNAAKAILKDPSLKTRINKIVMMGGWFTNEVPEWNILCDPEAADIVFSSGIEVDAIGLDVTLQCTLEENFLEVLDSKKDERSQLLNTWLKRWFNHSKFAKSVMHDPLAISTIFSPTCNFEKRAVKVNLDQNRGSIKILDLKNNAYRTINVAVSVDKKAFFTLFAERLLK